ncbi:hypothetical protein [Phenylobacterium sp.]|uniref:hypothetical protein n=1 Tax=Phenylobacterium sp. TaxID=1871053 RepID=UPI00271E9161|nr:hypothetical protein [Phenylobacterium sp.]MDO8801019.1 hypothetical protein [Phenylobacterium sp.]
MESLLAEPPEMGASPFSRRQASTSALIQAQRQNVKKNNTNTHKYISPLKINSVKLLHPLFQIVADRNFDLCGIDTAVVAKMARQIAP